MNISPAIQGAFSRSLLQVQKHAPTILTGIGITSVVAATFFAAKNTLKLEETLDEGKARLDRANTLVEAGEAKESALTKAYVINVAEVAKLYALPASLLVGGILCTLGGQHILNKRNAALAAAYNGLAASYEAYRERVANEVGEERERELFYGEETVTETVDGKKVVTKRLVDGEHTGHPYRFVYDSQNDNWTGFHDENLFRLQVAQNMFNDLLKVKKHILLRDVLNVLGIQDTPASCVTGWIFDEDDPNHTGDNFIEFNVRDYQAEYGYILLDFNCDGTIFDKI